MRTDFARDLGGSNGTITAFDELVDAFGDSLARGLVPARLYNDAAIHQLELERIFGRAWLFVGHVSEIPSPGDYRLRYIGEDTFIFIRDEAGEIHVFLDACRHRGTQLCRAEKGNTSHFRCPYHGWTFKNDGRLIGIPAFQRAYGGLKKEEWGLWEAAKVESYRGLVFATIDPTAPPLAEYLGEITWYLDLLFGVGEPEVIGEPHRWIIDSNWKIGAENFAGDDYHAVVLHKSIFEIGVLGGSPAAVILGHHILAGGPAATHTASLLMAPDETTTTTVRADPGASTGKRTFVGPAIPIDVAETLDMSRLSDAQRGVFDRFVVYVGTIFPNLSVVAAALTPDPQRRPIVMWGLRQWQPKGPGKMEVWSWVFTWKDTPEAFKRESYDAHMGTFSPSGIFEQDDTDPWSSITRSAGSVFARTRNMELNYQMGMPGIGTATQIDDFPGPGTVTDIRYEEGVQRSLLENWMRYMRRP